MDLFYLGIEAWGMSYIYTISTKKQKEILLKYKIYNKDKEYIFIKDQRFIDKFVYDMHYFEYKEEIIDFKYQEITWGKNIVKQALKELYYYKSYKKQKKNLNIELENRVKYYYMINKCKYNNYY